ncbi:MAG: hybrid sensor histidine kinase/response regulator [Betaproteobacteria bacterium]|nr:hybrid sensor histidine kinase/response regulator [Betaproteobacteria bacterium]
MRLPSGASAQLLSAALGSGRSPATVRVQLLARAVRMGSLSAALFVPLLAWVAHAHASPLRVALWLAAGALISVTRYGLAGACLRAVEAGPLTDEQAADWRRRLLLGAALGGANGLLATLLLMPGIDHDGMALLTMLLVCWSTGPLSATHAIPEHATTYATVFFPPVMLCWLASPFPGGWAVAAVLVLLVASLLGQSRANGRTLSGALDLAVERSQLAREVSQQRTAVEATSNAKSLFIAAASHDLRQPVTSLKIVVEMLRDPRVETAPERRAALLARLDTSVNALDDLLTGILDLSRLEADVVTANLAPTALDTLFEGLREAFAAQSSARGIELQFVPTDLVLVTDRVMLARMVRNLVDNALRYTPQGSVRVEAVRLPREVCIRVSDTGPGIPADQHARIFDDFIQLQNPARDRSRGLGLGLAIVRRLCARLGYQISLSSSPGQGTIFTIVIPADRIAARALIEPPAPEASSNSLRGLRVLLVEDDPLVRDALSLGLARLGAQVTPVPGVSALQTMLRDQRPAPAWDACVTDMRMEDESSGYQVIAALAGRLPRDRVVVLTGETRPDLVAAMTANGLRLVHKPATSAQVATALRQALAARQGAEADADETAGR